MRIARHEYTKYHKTACVFMRFCDYLKSLHFYFFAGAVLAFFSFWVSVSKSLSLIR